MKDWENTQGMTEFLLIFLSLVGWGFRGDKFLLGEPVDEVLGPLGGVVIPATEAEPVASSFVKFEFGGDVEFLEGLVEEDAVLGHDAFVVFGMEEKGGRGLSGDVFV